MMEKQEQPYVAALIDSFGELYLTKTPVRSIGMNRSTGEATNLLPGMDYIPLTREQLEDYEREGHTVKKRDGELMVKIGKALLNPRRIEVISE